jgi:hypothetical protein
MKKMLCIVLTIGTSTASAEVFKCKLASGVIEYKASACASSAVKQDVVNIKVPTPQEQEQAQQKLQAWREQNTAYEAEKSNAEKKRRAEQERQSTLNVQNLDVITREQQALATQRLATDMEINNTVHYGIQPSNYEQ